MRNNLDPSEWQKVKEVFEAALEQPIDTRLNFIDQECAGNPTIRKEVNSLLRSYEKSESFMEAPAVAAAAESLLGQHDKLSTGQRLNHYEIISLIGEGGMGEVYLAKDTTLGRRVALKLLPRYISNDPDRLRRFKQEARTASALSHPNVCVIHEISESEDGRPFIAMEYVEGITLRQRIADKNIKLGDVLDVAVQIADALRAAHEAGIVHRDIKPENIMIRRDGYVKVLDFGLAKLTEQRNPGASQSISTLFVNSSPGSVMGTAGYMSPEQARGVGVDERTDIWSLGVVLYEMLTGHPPFSGATPTDVVIAIVEKEPKPVAQYTASVPAELERIVRKALRKDADERYQIVKEMAIDLRSLRKDLEKDMQLERSIVPILSIAASQTAASPGTVITGPENLAQTDQLNVSRLTQIHTDSKPGADWYRRSVWLLAVLVIAGVLFGLYKFLKSSAPPAAARFQKINVTKLTTNGNALFASISPDGKYVAYVKSEGGKESLWLRQVGTAGNLEVVPFREGHYLGVAFSPDGEFIYYGYTISTANEAGEIFKLPVLGRGAPPVKVNPEEGPSSRSHDGKRIAFLRHSRGNQADSLVVANADGTNEQTLVTRKWPDRFALDWSTAPAWTSDDLYLDLPLVNTDANGAYIQIYEIRLTDRTEKTLAMATQRFEQPNSVNLLSDASAVILAGRAQGASFEQIWYLGRDGSARPLTNDLSDYRAVILTADSKSLVSTQTQTLGNIWVGSDGKTEPSQLTVGFGRYFDLSWAPDNKIVYASDASGSADLYDIAAKGGSVRQLTSGSKRNYAPSVSPDNRFIAFHSNRSGVFQIWRIDRDGSNPVQLTFGNSESHWPQFSADGKFVIYQHFESGQSATLWRIPVEGGTAVKVSDGFAVRPAISPDGKWLGFWYNDGQPNSLWKVGLFSFETGKRTGTFELPPTMEVSWDTVLRWSADSKELTYVSNRDGFENIWGQPIDGGPAHQITTLKDRDVFSYDWARDGSLAISKGVITSDVVLITDAER